MMVVMARGRELAAPELCTHHGHGTERGGILVLAIRRHLVR